MIDYKEQLKDPRWAQRRREIMERDNFTCQLCGKSNVKLNVHHIRYIKGMNYWEYPGNLLMTVCEVCHSKIHGKFFKQTKSRHKTSVFYNCFFKGHNGLKETNDKIILSYLCYKSIEGNGTFLVNNYKISKDLNLSFNTVKNCILRLKENGLISIKDKLVHIRDIEQIKTSYYFELLLDTNLKGEKLIVYSYLKNKSNKYGNVISTFDVNQAKEFYMSKKHYQKILCELYKKGFAERFGKW